MPPTVKVTAWAVVVARLMFVLPFNAPNTGAVMPVANFNVPAVIFNVEFCNARLLFRVKLVVADSAVVPVYVLAPLSVNPPVAVVLKVKLPAPPNTPVRLAEVLAKVIRNSLLPELMPDVANWPSAVGSRFVPLKINVEPFIVTVLEALLLKELLLLMINVPLLTTVLPA